MYPPSSKLKRHVLDWRSESTVQPYKATKEGKIMTIEAVGIKLGIMGNSVAQKEMGSR